MSERSVTIPAESVRLDADLLGPDGPSRGVVVFVHGSGSSRHSPRNRAVAHTLVEAGLAALLLDLLTPAEEDVDRRTRELRFNIDLLASRTVCAAQWAAGDGGAESAAVGLFGASTGGAAAIKAAAALPEGVRAIVSRGGRPDLAGDALPAVRCPTLLIVGGLDEEVLELNRAALARLECVKRLEVVPNATHLFEEPGALEVVATLARDWFVRHLA